MSAVTVDEIYNQAQQLSTTEREQLFSRLLDDFAPEPPNTFHSEEELSQMLRAGIGSGPATPLEDQEWDEMRQEVRARAARRAETLSSHA